MVVFVFFFYFVFPSCDTCTANDLLYNKSLCYIVIHIAFTTHTSLFQLKLCLVNFTIISFHSQALKWLSFHCCMGLKKSFFMQLCMLGIELKIFCVTYCTCMHKINGYCNNNILKVFKKQSLLNRRMEKFERKKKQFFE